MKHLLALVVALTAINAQAAVVCPQGSRVVIVQKAEAAICNFGAKLHAKSDAWHAAHPIRALKK